MSAPPTDSVTRKIWHTRAKPGESRHLRGVAAASTISPMPVDPLHAPWRMQYIRSLAQPGADERCFICDAVRVQSEEQRRARLVLWSTDLSIVIVNLFPYTNGHLLIAPKAHKPELEQLTREETLDMQLQTTRAVELLKRAISPQGFNIGINLGRCAGAGLPGHIHQHVVPRWAGDTNFITVVGEVRVVPHAISQLYDELAAVFQSMQKEQR